MMTTVQYTINDHDLVNALYYHYHKTGSIRKRIIRGRVIYGILAIFFITLSDDSNWVLWFTLVPFIIIYILMYSWYIRYVFKKHCRKVVKHSYANLARENQFQLTDNTITFYTEQGTTALAPSGIVELCETADYFMLFIQGGQVIPLPKTDFNQLVEQLKVYCEQYQIQWSEDANWKMA